MEIGTAISRGSLKTEEIVDMVGGRRGIIIAELKTMTEDGTITCVKNKGQGGGNVYTFPPSDVTEKEVPTIPISKGGTSFLTQNTEDF